MYVWKDLSPLPPLLVEALWNGVRSRLVPLEVGERADEGFLEQPRFGKGMSFSSRLTLWCLR